MILFFLISDCGCTTVSIAIHLIFTCSQQVRARFKEHDVQGGFRICLFHHLISDVPSLISMVYLEPASQFTARGMVACFDPESV